MKKAIYISLLSLLICSCSSTKKEASNTPTVEPTDITPVTEPSVPVIIDPTPVEFENVFNDPYLGRQYYLNHIGDIYNSWQLYRGRGVTVAVIDKAFHAYHEDFYDKNGKLCVSDLSASFVNKNGTVTKQVGIDYVNDLSDSHGTFCAGIVGARANSKGVVGIAPESNLMLLKVDGKPKSIVEAFKYAADNGARVITISIGSYYNYDGDLINDGSDLSTVFNSAISYCHQKGVVVCSAAGNGGGSEETVHEYTFPGACQYVIGCGGLEANSNESVWEYSSYNSSSTYQFVDVFAPSDMMFGCSNYYDDNHSYVKYDGGWKGTSFSSPIVAGLAALYFEQNPRATCVDFENDLYASCHKLKNSKIGTVNQLGYGRVDVGALLFETQMQKTVTLKVKSNSSSMNVYAWNSNLSLNKEIGSWPGKAMSKVDGYFTYSLNIKDYDLIIFNYGSNQTIDLLASSFIQDNAYDISNPTREMGLLVGKYI